MYVCVCVCVRPCGRVACCMYVCMPCSMPSSKCLTVNIKNAINIFICTNPLSVVYFFFLTVHLFYTTNPLLHLYTTPVWCPPRNRNQNQNCLLVTRRNDNHSPWPWPGRLVPSSHQRTELSNPILCAFSRGKKGVWKCIPISNSLGKEATLINISVSNVDLNCQRMMISAAHNQGG